MHEHDAESQGATRRKAELDPEDRLEPAGPAGPEDDPLLDLMERWEDRFRDGEDVPPESLGVDDAELREVLRERIERQKRLYACMGRPPSEPDRRAAPVEEATPPGSAPIPSPSQPSAIGRYRVVRVLGEGGFGRVYLAFDSDLQREVAVKVPLLGEASRFLDVEAYLREARIVARLSHPNIVPVYDVGRTDDGRCYVVTKHMEGGDLKARLARGRPAFAESAGLVAVACEALQYTHTHDLFHRDIKPANILLDAAGVPSLADFGLALKDEDVGRGAGYLGTAAYMSPEQARGEGHRVDGRSDIFSIGVVLYELLTGRRPFRGGSHVEIMQQVIGAEPRPPRQIDGTIPGELERICLKAMAKRASERYTTARDLADDLQHFLETASWSGGPTAEVPPVVAPAREPAPGSSDSRSRPINIVPKGLGSFDEHDADFYLELLPGPRDRDGLPDGLRFWKTRIEAADPDRTFRVGLIYGPSGCGKSSMVKAGLLPRLGPQICAIYVEAAGADTDLRLLRSLRRFFPVLTADGGLAGGLKVLRRGHGLPAGRKVLLVLDQFEQWLFGRRDERGDDLIAALRQCDGERVQALCLVRDDFWMAATRFMKDLDIDLVPERNVAAVDLFEPRHARRVLAAYGRAYDALPTSSGELPRDQESFLDQAVAGLSQDGLIVPVRLALFAEMVKGRPWTSATLREVGGMEGVGLKFLEDTFSSPRSHPNHRYHQRAAQAVLKALLPENNADIKGRMRSVEELRELSGYGERPSDFADLIRMLDGELRLITPVDPEGSVDEELPVPVAGGHYFQLTHDYLVHALREWLTRKLRETRRGRAELLLAERSALWAKKPEDRYLPSVREWTDIRLLTRRLDWSDLQRRMMRRVGRRIGIRAGGLAIAVVAVAFAGLEIYGAFHARGLVDRLTSAETARVPGLLPGIREYRRWTEPRLRQVLAEAPDTSKEEFHARLALQSIGVDQVEYLYGRLLAAGPAEMEVIRDALAPHRDSLSGRLWQELRPARPGDGRILPVAAALASYDPDLSGWPELGDKTVGAMVRAPLAEVQGWGRSLRPIRRHLVEPLARIMRDAEYPNNHHFAASLLVDYLADEPSRLVDLYLDADSEAFPTLFQAVQARATDCLAGLRAAVALASPGPRFEAKAAADAAASGPGPSPERLEHAKDRLASRGAHAAVALIRLGYADEVWPLLEYSPDPRSRSALIIALSTLGADPAPLAARLERVGEERPGAGLNGGKNAYLFEPATSMRRALILALAAFPRESLGDRPRDALTERLAALHRDDPDAGVHAAADLILRRWGYADRLTRGPTPGPRPGGPIERRWYINPEGQTMVVIDGPVTFDMGSPRSDPDAQPEEVFHPMTVPRRFAIASREVTVEEFQRFAAIRWRRPHEYNKRFCPDPDGPAVGMSLFEAAAYCNWLSEREGLTPCYKLRRQGDGDEEMGVDDEAIARGAYRLPTEAEFEYASRAGTVTSRYYGHTLELLDYFERYYDNTGFRARSCSRLLPNEFGLFDTLGNVQEWCQDRAEIAGFDSSTRKVDDLRSETVGKDTRVIRAGSYRTDVVGLRSATRGWINSWGRKSDLGFRSARTCP